MSTVGFAVLVAVAQLPLAADAYGEWMPGNKTTNHILLYTHTYTNTTIKNIINDIISHFGFVCGCLRHAAICLIVVLAMMMLMMMLMMLMMLLLLLLMIRVTAFPPLLR